MGREQLKVYLEIDYIRFRPAAKEEDEEVARLDGAAEGECVPDEAADERRDRGIASDRGWQARHIRARILR